MRYLVFILALAGFPAFGCENTDAFFERASDEELINCIRGNTDDFITSRDEQNFESVLHKIVRKRRSASLIDEVHSRAGDKWDTIRQYVTTPDGKTPLHYAAQYALEPSVVSRLIHYGFGPDAKTDEIQVDKNATPLYYAAQRADAAGIVAALLAGGADQTETEASVRYTPLMTAAANAEDGRIIAVLLADREVSLTGTIRSGILELTDKRGNTALNIAANQNRPFEAIRLLVEAGSNVDKANNKGFTPLLSAAAYSEYPEVVDYLFEKSTERCAKTTEEKDGKPHPRDGVELLQANTALSDNFELKRMFQEECRDKR